MNIETGNLHIVSNWDNDQKRIVSSYSPDVYSRIVETYKHIAAYSNATDMGMKCINGAQQKTEVYFF